MDVIVKRCAGLDVHKEIIVACVRVMDDAGKVHKSVKTFKTMTGDLRRMRATTTLGLTHSDGYVLFADPNPLKTPDHLHYWYPFWDVKLGRPLAPRTDRADGASVREFAGGTVVYNHFGNQPATVRFDAPRRRASDGTTGREFVVSDADGDIFLKL